MADSLCGASNPAGATQGGHPPYGIRPLPRHERPGRGAVKRAISLPRAVFGMPVKEQGPKLVDRAMKGEL